VLFQGRGRVQKKVVEVQQLGLGLDRLVGAVDVDHLLGRCRRLAMGTVGGRRVVVRRYERRLRPFDLGREVAQQLNLGVRADLVCGLAHEPQLHVDQVPLLPADHPRPEVAELAQRGGVKGAGLGGVDVERAQPGAHLPRCPRRVGDREHLTCGDVAGVDEVGDPVHDRARLTGASAGKYAHRPARCADRGQLLRVEPGDELVFARPHAGILTEPGVDLWDRLERMCRSFGSGVHLYPW
jgi:hypothetical protein